MANNSTGVFTNRSVLNVKSVRLFKRFSLITLLLVYVVILAGGVVRSTGSGMGCPDWPKCFGSWVPPTSEARLPLHYKELYAEKRMIKTRKVAKMLAALGFSETANRLLTDPIVQQEQPFNALKTWIEYVNRLAGALIGLFIVAAFVLSVRLRNHDARVPVLGLAAVVLVGFEGWLGSIVVAANLMPFTVTLHMLLAIALVAVIIYSLHRVETIGVAADVVLRSGVRWLIRVLFFLCLFQVLLGTEVREQVDVLTLILNGHQGIVDSLGTAFLVHRSFSLVILACSVWLAVRVKAEYSIGHTMYRSARILFVFLGLEVASGIVLAYADIPVYVQPIHLTVGVGLLGWLLHMTFSSGRQAVGSVNSQQNTAVAV